MYRSKVFLFFMLVGFINGLGVNGTIGQVVNDAPSKPRTVGDEKNVDVYEKWLSKDARYIVTKEEKRAFKSLKTDEERENFIENFWRRRDPNPDTEENEYREEYYERIAYANEHFASGKPGWMTDRGRIYITQGKPDSVESHPMGGSYNRPSYEGGGTTSTYPFEIWFYRHLDGVGNGIEIEFVDPTGSGEYRIATNPNEKDALLFIPGAGLTTSEALGLSSKADRISGINGNNYGRTQDSPFRRLEIQKDLSIPPRVRFGGLQKTLSGSGVFDDQLEFDLQVDFFRRSEDKVLVAFTLQTENKELSFKDVGGVPTATLNIFGTITSVAERRAGIFEDSVTTSATTADLAQARNLTSIYQTARTLTPGGTYKVDVIVRDVKSGRAGVQKVGFTVPKYDDKKLWTSTLILASTLRQTTDHDIGGRFVIGGAKVIPNLSGVYKRGQQVGIYLQVYNARIDQTTLRPGADIRYILLRNNEVLFTQEEDWSGLSDSADRLTLARLLPTVNLSPGEYQIKIKITDNVGEKRRTLEPTAKFTIKE